MESGNATSETEAPSWSEWNRSHLGQPCVVARAGETILGWGALSPVTERCICSELPKSASTWLLSQGVGPALLAAMIEVAEQSGIWTLQGNIFRENEASLALEKKRGFREVGRREKLGQMFYGLFADIWRDVVLAERRSRVVGVG